MPLGPAAMPLDTLFAHRPNMAAMPSIMTPSSGSRSSNELPSFSNRAAYPKSSIEVQIKNHYSSKVYTSGSVVEGDVAITTRRDVRFDSIQILLMGVSRSRVDGVNSPYQVMHTFLKMAMPVPESSYPVPRVLESGTPYSVPFHFVIPHQLTINACNHGVRGAQVHAQHTLPPPSMGGAWDKDDMAPQMGTIEWSVKARVFRQPELAGPKFKVMEATQVLHVLPASYEEPPLSLTPKDKLYRMAKTKTLRRSLLSGKLGRVTAEVEQPAAVFVAPDGRSSAGTVAQVALTFQPAAPDVAPPRVTAVAAKVVAHTFFSSGTIASFPNLADWDRQVAVDRRGSYAHTVPLPAAAGVAPVRWEQHAAAPPRRDSGYLSGGSDGGRTKAPCPVFHKATLRVPVRLPMAKKAFIPTFHSCIASRVYVLRLEVALAAEGGGSTTVSLAAPLQVAVGCGLLGAPVDVLGGLPSFEEAEADEYMRPRTLGVPELQYQATSLLPGYAELAIAR